MTLEFPEGTATIRCPHCTDKCSFTTMNPIGWTVVIDKVSQKTILETAYCQTCGGCITRQMIKGKTAWRVIYPKGTTRDKAPSQVSDADKDLAGTYDEAVACEHDSKIAAVFLLGRCAEKILIDMGKVDRRKTLGPMIDEAIENEFLKPPLSLHMKDAFRIARNQAGHYWQDENGKELKVDKPTVDGSFRVIERMFKEFYIDPIELKAFEAGMQKTEEKKLAGENVKNE